MWISADRSIADAFRLILSDCPGTFAPLHGGLTAVRAASHRADYDSLSLKIDLIVKVDERNCILACEVSLTDRPRGIGTLLQRFAGEFPDNLSMLETTFVP